MVITKKRLLLNILALTIVFLILFSNSQGILGQPPYNTTNFSIDYTDDFVNDPLDAVTLARVQEFGDDILEVVRSKLINDYNFKDPGTNIPVEILHFTNLNAYASTAISLEFDSYFLGNPTHGLVTETENYSAPLHEYFHLTEFGYSVTDDWKLWILDGQSRMIQDKIFPALDSEVGTDMASYYGQIVEYLGDPDRPLMTLGYNAVLFWTYITEQFGTITTEPDYGLDAIRVFWEAAESIGSLSDPIAVINQMLKDLGHNSVTFHDVFKDFIVANYAKDLTGPNVPDKYHYKDETQTPGTYGPVTMNSDENLAPGGVSSELDQEVRYWAPKYHRVKPTGGRGLITVEVDQETDNTLFYDLLVVKNNDIVEETRITGKDFSRSIYTDADEIVLIVAGLENIITEPAEYDYFFTSGETNLVLDILKPLGTSAATYARAGSHTDPEKFLSIVEVTNNGNPVHGLKNTDFTVQVGTEDATVVNCAYIYGLYFLEIQAPTQSAAGLYDLTISVAGKSQTEASSVDYSDLVIDTMIVLDKSGSMSISEKIDAAKAAGRLYVDSYFLNDLIGLTQFEQDALLMQGLAEISTIRGTIHDIIDEIIADGPATSIGDGLLVGQDELYINGDPNHPQHIVLLTDGRENIERWIDDVDHNLLGNGTILDVVLIGADAQTDTLQELALNTGGSVFFALNPSSGTLASDLASIYRTIAESLRNEQRIFSSQNQYSDSWSIYDSFYQADASELIVTLNYKAENSLSSEDIRLQLPIGTPLIPSYTDEKLGAANYYGHLVWTITNPNDGYYSVNFTGTGDIEYFFEAAVRDDISAHMHIGVPNSQRIVGKMVPIIVTISDQSPIQGAKVIAEITSGTSYLDAHTWSLQLFDDGAHNDGLANDGVYGNYFTRTGHLENATTFIVKSLITGTSNYEQEFTRELNEAFHMRTESGYDEDSDGLPDVWENQFNLDPTSATGKNGRNGDPDLDNLVNYQELAHGTSPINPDTDSGGESDYSEVQGSRDPYNSSDDVINPPYVIAQPKNKIVELQYSLNPNYDTMEIYRSITPNTGFALIDTQLPPLDGKYLDTDVLNDNTYYYKVVAISTEGDISGFSSMVGVTPKEDLIAPYGHIRINSGNRYTADTSVTLSIRATDAVKMRISNKPDFTGASWENYKETKDWTLAGTGLQYVYAQFRDSANNIGGFINSSTTFDGIIVDESYIETTTTTQGKANGFLVTITISSFITLVVIDLKRRKRKKLF